MKSMFKRAVILKNILKWKLKPFGRIVWAPIMKIVVSLCPLKVAGENRSGTNRKQLNPVVQKWRYLSCYYVYTVAGSHLVGGKSKWYFITKCSLLLSMILGWRKISPDAGKQLKMSLLQVSSEMTTQRNGFGQNSCAADQQVCVFGSCECKNTLF